MADRTILIAVDAGARTLDAVRLGERLARVSGLPATLATAFSPVLLQGEAEAAMREEARQTLLELGGTMEGVNVVDARVVEGHSPARALHDLSEDEHAWWAAREEVAGVPRGTPLEEEVDPNADRGFADYWSAESLFDEQPKPPPTATDGADTQELAAGAMDLDSAHLVLQVSVGAEWEVVVKAHRKLAKLYHPDRLIEWSPEAQEYGRLRMSEINEAHATLRALHFH